MEEQHPIPGKVTIESEVLETIAGLTAQGVPGVARMAQKTDVERFLGLGSRSVQVRVSEGRVGIDLHIMAEPGISLLRLGRDIQKHVTQAIQQTIGMPVEVVNVYIEDVIFPSSAGEQLAG
ncbi:MAG: Asp23/Gls24 family envelope stress response protein [Anaerolineae bacterium]|nr:Asp23/Gls24 family envelope stress response protein [Anaerolineae bacterium]